MADPKELISDILGLPPDERTKVYANSNMASMVESALQVDVDYQSLGEEEKNKVKANLGLPTIAEATPTQPIVSAVDLLRTERRHQQELPSVIPKLDYYRQYWKKAFEPLSQPIAQSLSQPQSMLETPFGAVNVGTEGNVGSAVRGVLKSNPLTSQLVPSGAPEPSFLSIENAARIATEGMLTAPLLGGKLSASAARQLATTGFFKFFLRYPSVAHAVASATVQSLPLTAYNQFSRKVSEMLSKGETSLDNIAIDFGEEYAQTVALLTGFHGLVRGTIGGAKFVYRKVAGKPSVSPAPPAPKSPEAQAHGDVVENVAQDIGEATEAVNIAAREPLPALGTEYPKIGEASTSATARLGQEAVTAPIAPTQQLLKTATETITPAYKPGFLLTAEEKVRGYPKAAKIVEDVTSPTQTVVRPDGSMTSVIPENVMKAGFIAQEDALVGDLVYANGNVAQVVDKLARGLKVRIGNRPPYFVPFEKVTGKPKFAPGDEVFMPSGEGVIVDTIPSKGNVRVVNPRGTRFVISEDKLASKAEQLSQQETAERAANGIADPAPSGNSVWEWIDDVFKDRPGFFRPGIFFGGGKQKGGAPTVPLQLTTQPGKENFGGYRYYIDPPHTFMLSGKPQYVRAAKMIYDSKTEETIVQTTAEQMIRTFKGQVGADNEVSKKLTRALVGLAKASDKLTNDEKAVISTVRLWAQQQIIPVINKGRAAAGEPPVPNDYNYPFQLFSDVLLARGRSTGGLAEMFGKFITPTGVENYATTAPFGSVVRLEIEANFWELLDRMSKYVAHERGWRNTLQYLEIVKNAEASPSNKKFVSWYIQHLKGYTGSPDIAEFTKSTNWMEQQLQKRIGSVGSAKMIASNGTEIPFDLPPVELATKTLNSVVLNAKSLNYSAMIGFNLRTMALNLTQPITNGLAQIPGNPIAAAFDLLAGYTKASGTLAKTLFGKEALEHYRKLGVLHDIEEVFAPTNISRVSGGAFHNVTYAADWTKNTLLSASFLGMRAAELVNRVSVYEAHLMAGKRLARQFGEDKNIMAVVNSPDFQHALSNMATYATNIANFLYGKGFKAPLQTGVLPIGGGRDINIGPVGEMVYTFNTFATKHMATMAMLYKQLPARLPGAEGRISAAGQLAALDAPKEFGNYLAYLKPSDRYAFLKAMIYQSSIASFLSATLGLGSLAAAISPLGMVGVNAATTMMKATGDLTHDLFRLDVRGLTKTMFNNFTPGVNAARRWQRGGTFTQRTLATRADVEGKRPAWAAPTTYELLFGAEYPSGTKSP